MKTIKIYTPDIDLVGEVSNYESIMHTLSRSDIGTLVLRIKRDNLDMGFFRAGNIIVVDNAPLKSYQILHNGAELDQQGELTGNWNVIAQELKVIASRYISMPPDYSTHDSISGPAESVIKHYVQRNLVNPSDPRRKIPQLVVAPDLQRGPHIEWQSRYKNLADEFTDISLQAGIGWRVCVNFETKKWVFDCFESRNSPIYLSTELKAYVGE